MDKKIKLAKAEFNERCNINILESLKILCKFHCKSKTKILLTFAKILLQSLSS